MEYEATHDPLFDFKQNSINNYMTSIMDEEIDAEKIKRDIRTIIGEYPGVSLNYSAEMMLSEGDSKPKRLEKLSSIFITYTYGDVDKPHAHTLKYIIG